MSYMVFPDDVDRRTGAEITFRTVLADWYSDRFAKLKKGEQRRAVRQICEKRGADSVPEISDPAEWMREQIFSKFLRPASGISRAALLLAISPSAEELAREWTNRWWSIVYAGKLLCLIGSIAQHYPNAGASLNKAIDILCRTEGNDKERMKSFRSCGFPAVYESSLKKAWSRFKPVAHLCAAYVTTETHFYEQEISRDFWEYWEQPPAFYDDEVFAAFCVLAKSAEKFATAFLPRGQRQALISKEQMFSLPDEIFKPGASLPPFRKLTDEEAAALANYRAPKRVV
jgi:hypothetical protein